MKNGVMEGCRAWMPTGTYSNAGEVRPEQTLGAARHQHLRFRLGARLPESCLVRRHCSQPQCWQGPLSGRGAWCYSCVSVRQAPPALGCPLAGTVPCCNAGTPLAAPPLGRGLPSAGFWSIWLPRAAASWEVTDALTPSADQAFDQYA